MSRKNPVIALKAGRNAGGAPLRKFAQRAPAGTTGLRRHPPQLRSNPGVSLRACSSTPRSFRSAPRGENFAIITGAVVRECSFPLLLRWWVALMRCRPTLRGVPQFIPPSALRAIRGQQWGAAFDLSKHNPLALEDTVPLDLLGIAHHHQHRWFATWCGW